MNDKDWFNTTEFNLSQEDKAYKKRLKVISDSKFIIMLLADLMGSISRQNKRKCIRLVEAHRRNHKVSD